MKHKYKNKTIRLFTFVFMSVFASLFFNGSNVNAEFDYEGCVNSGYVGLSANEIEEVKRPYGAISAFHTACDNCSDWSCENNGALWINSSDKNSGIESYRNALSSVDEENGGMIPVYIHGQVYTGSQSSIGGGMVASHIYIMTPKAGVKIENELGYSSLEKASYIISDGDFTLNRVDTSVRGTYKWGAQNEVSAGMTLDAEKFFEVNGCDSGKEKCTAKNVYIFRCPGFPSAHAESDGACWGNRTTITITKSPRILDEKIKCADWSNDETTITKDYGISLVKTRLNKNGASSWTLGKTINVGWNDPNPDYNNELGNYIYAKPGDKITYEHCYASGVQKIKDTKLSDGNTVEQEINKLWGGPIWGSSFDINPYNMTDRGKTQANNFRYHTEIFQNGLVTNASFKDNVYTVNGKNVGGTFKEVNVSSSPSMVKIENKEIVAKDKFAASLASVLVPYNFQNKASVAFVNPLDNKIYAGETATFGINSIKTEPIYNKTTDGTYATVSPHTKIKTFYYVSGGDDSKEIVVGENADVCTSVSALSGKCQIHISGNPEFTINSENNLNGSSNISAQSQKFSSKTVNVWDTDAGNYFCVAIGIWPASSNGTDMEGYGDRNWRINSTCQKIYKKPTFQVRGGSIYANGGVVANVGVKNNLENIQSYSSTGGTKHYFNSWAEYGIIANGLVSNVASGNSGGYSSNVGGSLSFIPGGSTNGDMCLRSPLTIANKKCMPSSVELGGAGVPISQVTKEQVDRTYISQAKTAQKIDNSRAVVIDLSNSANYVTINGVRYTYLAGSNKVNLIAASQELPVGVTHVVYSEGALVICCTGDMPNMAYKRNLRYSSAAYTDAGDVPQYIIAADKDINLDWSTDRVDAWLITSGKVNTCTGFNGTVQETDNAACNHQLTINGLVIANEIIMNRTYGANTGANSGVPAEIVNFTPATFMYSMSGESETPSLYTSYTKELAPRL